MFLRSMEIQGFKSFPDKVTLLFDSDMTAIVGPNGSGKSNISDAILWVLGEQSSRTLRGLKMEDVIFGGTEKRAPLGFAEASLCFSNPDGALPVEAQEVTVTRRYYRSGDSEFYINQKSARLKDIHELFMDTGLGCDGYSNISQGRIDEILSLKSTDRREVFEEAAGISKYRHRKEETERRLAGTEDNLLRIGDKISEIQLQVEPLKKQAQAARKYLDTQAELRGLEIAIWLSNLEKLAAAAKKAESDYSASAFVLEQEHSHLDRMYGELEALEQDLLTADRDLESRRTALSQKTVQGRELEGQLAVLKSSLQNQQDNTQRIQDELDQQASRREALSKQIETARNRISEIDGILTEKQTLLKEHLSQVEALTASTEGNTRKYLELRSTQSELQATLSGGKADLAALEASTAQTQSRLSQVELDGSGAMEREAQAKSSMDLCRRTLEMAREKVRTLETEISRTAATQRDRKEQCKILSEQVQKTASTLEAVSAKVRLYRALENGFENYQKSVRAVMQEARRGNLHHIHGPISQLIRTEDRYTTAVEIALGPAMQQLVVDREEDAKAAISFLKSSGSGRATFLPISAIRPRLLQEKGLEGKNGFIGLASELVQCEKIYQPILQNLLGRIVLVETLDDAISMAKAYGNRFKIVTLDGQVMNPGGSMTGGSVSKEAGLLSRANELLHLSDREKGLEQQQTEQTAALKAAQEALEQAEAQQITAQGDLREAEKQVLRLEGEEKQHGILVEALGETLDARKQEKDSLKARLSQDQSKMAELRQQQEGRSYRLEALEEALDHLSRDQSDAARASERLTAAVASGRTEIAALESERRSLLENADRLSQLQSAMEGDRTEKETLLTEYRTEQGRLTDEITDLEAQRDTASKDLSDLQGQLGQVQKQRAQLEAQKTKTQREVQEKNKTILTMERACGLLEQKKLTASMEERQVLDRLWESYQLTPTAAQAEKAPLESVAAGNRRIAELRKQLSDLGTPNLGAIEEYERVRERYTYLSTQRDDVATAKKDLEQIIRDITAEMTAIFVEEFHKIRRYFEETFLELFGGGKGTILLEDPEHPLSCGIEIRVQPPGKQLKTLSLLSGGEKAFVAICLYFAILKVRPTPFCMLDEIDAALDDRNVERFSRYLRRLCPKTQFIVITHRRGTMEQADTLYGVTMEEQGVSKLLRMDLARMERELGITE